jgi:hypothetical protein
VPFFSAQIPTLKVWSLVWKFSPPDTIPKFGRKLSDQKRGLVAFLDQIKYFWMSSHPKSILDQTVSALSGLKTDQIACHRVERLLFLESSAPSSFMASLPEATPEPGSPPSAWRSRGKGKGLAWSDVENVALCDGHQQVSERAEIGAGMRKAEFHRRLQARLRSSSRRPRDACTLEGTGCPLDKRRWEGRSPESVGKQWDKIKSACTKMYSVVRRIDAMELTGGQTADDLWRCALAVYNEGSSMMSHLYDISNNPKYKVGPEFPFRTSYDYLSKRTTILNCGGTNELRPEISNDNAINDEVTDAAVIVEDSAQSRRQDWDQDPEGEEKDISGTVVNDSGSRTRGVKAAKKRRLASFDGSTSVEEQAQIVLKDIACSNSKLSAAYENSQRQKVREVDRKAAMEEKRLRMKKYELILGDSSVAPTSDKKRVMKLLLKSVLDEHGANFQQPGVRNLNTTLEISDSPSIEDGAEHDNDIDDDDEEVIS